VAVAAIGVCTAWFIHTSVDWIHLLPGVTVFAIVGAAVLLRSRSGGGNARLLPARGRRPQFAAAVVVAVALLTAAMSLTRQGLADRFRAAASEDLPTNPASALLDADRSLRLDPDAVPSYHIKAAALARFGKGRAARSALTEAARREPRDFVTWALLGDLAVRMGRPDEARRHYRRAAALNPRDPVLSGLATDAATVDPGADG
jgi:Flp pilus assembly protein TadD